jgi:hypothetical protein
MSKRPVSHWVLHSFLLICLMGCIASMGLITVGQDEVWAQESLNQINYRTRITMPLTIKLRDGFRKDTVTIRVDGKEVYHKPSVSTDLTISFADAVEVPVETSSVNLEVAVAGGPTVSQVIEVQNTPFVEVWMMNGRMELRTSREDVPMM